MIGDTIYQPQLPYDGQSRPIFDQSEVAAQMEIDFDSDAPLVCPLNQPDSGDTCESCQ